jgi:hypothetical protein
MERAMCPGWQNGFLLADGSTFMLFQKPELHGYMGRRGLTRTKTTLSTVRCMHHGDHCFQMSTQLTVTCSSDHQFASKSTHRWLLIWPHWQCAWHGLSKARILSRTMIRYLDLVNGCGWIPHRPGAMHHLRSPSTGSSLQTRGVTTMHSTLYGTTTVSAIYRYRYALSTRWAC